MDGKTWRQQVKDLEINQTITIKPSVNDNSLRVELSKMRQINNMGLFAKKVDDNLYIITRWK